MRYLSLSGLWDFRPADAGEYVSISVPGSWREDARFADFDGAAEYRRTFTLGDNDAAAHVELRADTVFRRAEFVLNGEVLPCEFTGAAPRRIDLTGHLRTGENELLIRIDSRRDPDAPPNAPLFDLLPLKFAGLCGDIRLEISEGCFIRSIYTPIRPEADEALLIFALHSDLCAPCKATLSFGFGDTHLGCSLTLSPGESELSLPIHLSGLRLWSPEDPFLYDISAELTADGKSDAFSGRTGFKRLECRGEEFYLNGTATYLLGYGDDFVHPGGLADVHNADYCRRALTRAREYGFNYARQHSHLPFESFLMAADEVGILIQPELALANVPRELLNGENKAPFIAEWQSMIREFRHHPCIGMWCGGNEMEWGIPFEDELYHTAKTMDPYRPVTATDGNFMACDVTAAQDFASVCPAEYTDYLPYGELSDMFLHDFCGKPQIVHEMGNYTTLPDIDLLKKYKNPRFIPKRFKALAESLTDDRLPRYRETLAATRELQKLCHKLNIEKARLSPHFAGYHVWTITDFYGTTQGILDPFYGDKAFTAEEFAAFNRQEVLLWDTGRVSFSAGERAELCIRLSRYGSDAPITDTLTLTLTDGQSYSLPVQIEGHGLFDLAVWHVTLPSTKKPLALTLTARMGDRENSWPLYVFPTPAFSDKREIYINYLSRHLFAGEIPVRHFTIPQPIGCEQLIVTEHLYGGMTDAVERGANLLLFAGADTFRETVTRNSFKSPWWETGEIWYLNHTNNAQACGIVAEHPATSAIPYRGAWQLDLFHAVEQAPAIDLDALKLDVEAPIFGVSKDLSRRGYLFEFSLGKGSVLVCTLNHSRRDMEDPAVRYFIRHLINYAMSPEFTPKKSLSAAEFKSLLKK